MTSLERRTILSDQTNSATLTDTIRSKAAAVSDTPAVQVSSVVKTFRGNAAVNEASFSVYAGEMVALVGASGSGKSTLLRCLNGLHQADSGTIEVFGTAIQSNGKFHSSIRRLRAQVGFIFQQFNLVNRLSVIENVMIGRLSNISAMKSTLRIFSQDEKAQALAALDRVGIIDHAYKRASALSGGQQQRVAIARCLMQRASIILADEPIASLDPQSAHRVMRLLVELNREEGMTVITSLHQVQMVRAYYPRAIALKDGAVRFDGNTALLSNDRLSEIYGAASDELVQRGHSDFTVDSPTDGIASANSAAERAGATSP